MSINGNNNDSTGSIDNSILKQFRCLVESHKKTRDFLIEDKVLIKFLRSRDLDSEEAHKVLIAYINAINDRPDLFSWDDCFKEILQAGIYYHYPVKNIDGSKIIILHPGKWNPSEISCPTIIAQTLFFVENTLMDEDIHKNGVVVIFDLRGLGWTQLYNCGLSNGKLLSDLSDRAIPWKINSVHVVYENRLTDAGYALFKPFIGAKLRARINFHGHDLEKLYRVIPKTYLPPSLGGTSQEYSAEYYDQLLMEKKEAILATWDKFKIKKEEVQAK